MKINASITFTISGYDDLEDNVTADSIEELEELIPRFYRYVKNLVDPKEEESGNHLHTEVLVVYSIGSALPSTEVFTLNQFSSFVKQLHSQLGL